MLGRALVFAGDYQNAARVLETALIIAEALELPDVLAEALANKAILYEFTGRPQEARGLNGTPLDVAERHELAEVHGRTLHNLANLGMLWDQPDARRHAGTPKQRWRFPAGLVIATARPSMPPFS
jgi:hypothetical protein